MAEAIAVVLVAHFPTPSTDKDFDDLYGDVNLGLGFLPLPPPSPTSPPKTPSPGRSIPSPPPPPRHTTPPKPQPEPEPEPKPKPTPQHQPPPLPATKPTPQHQPPPLPSRKPTSRHQPQRASSGTSPPTTALYIGELPWWTTDAEVEAALAPHGALRSLDFFADKLTGKSRGFCRADFLHPAAAASAAAALHGRRTPQTKQLSEAPDSVGSCRNIECD